MDRRILGVLFILSFFLWIGGAVWTVSHAHGSLETPAYTRIEKDGRVEVRDYPALRLARTALGGEARGSALSDGFSLLQGYIAGGNVVHAKISMISPVLVDRAEGGTLSFILPKELAQAPAPADPAVALADRAAARCAVIRYSGGRNEENEQKAAARLAAWLPLHGWEAAGTPLVAYYDPPWIPPFLRRNEVILPVRASHP